MVFFAKNRLVLSSANLCLFVVSKLPFSKDMRTCDEQPFLVHGSHIGGPSTMLLLTHPMWTGKPILWLFPDTQQPGDKRYRSILLKSDQLFVAKNASRFTGTDETNEKSCQRNKVLTMVECRFPMDPPDNRQTSTQAKPQLIGLNSLTNARNVVNLSREAEAGGNA